MRPTGPRDPYAGPEGGPEPPFPIQLSGPVIKGFGRGSRELGIPTANIPPSNLDQYPDLKSGVYFGLVGLRLTPTTTQPADNSKLTLSEDSSSSNNGDSNHDSSIPQDSRTGIYPSVLSIGYNPFYANTTRSIEIHILSHFPHFNFYHSPLNLLILGFIRPEYDYESLEALVKDIKIDCDVARRSLERDGYQKFREEKWLKEFGWSEDVDVAKVEGEVLKGNKKEETQSGGQKGSL